MTRPLAIDLFCGLGGWTEGLLAEGYEVIGYDIEEHVYGDLRYPAQLVVQDVLTIHGSTFKDAALIVASPPCQEYSYMAMPWSRAKAKAAAIRADTTGAELERLNRLFNACFRIQREASEAAGRHIPLIVENVRGAIPWVGRSRGNYGSFHLWGDVPALLPAPVGRAVLKAGVTHRGDGTTNFHGFKNAAVGGGSWFAIGSPGQASVGGNPDGRKRLHGVDHDTGVKIGGDWFSDPTSTCRRHGSKSKGRKAASALIAKIPLPLSRHIAATFRPAQAEAA